MRYIVLDFETTGLDYSFNEPCQVAAIILDNRLREVSSFSSMIRIRYPERIEPKALAIQGRNVEDLLSAPSIEQVFSLLLAFIGMGGNATLVGHNIGFDIKFLHAAEISLGMPLTKFEKTIDTCSLSRVWLQGRGVLNDSKLGTVARYYGVPHVAHDALGDVRASAEILACIVQEAPVLVQRELEGKLYSGLLNDALSLEPENQFILSCLKNYGEKGYLSPKQISALVGFCVNREKFPMP